MDIVTQLRLTKATEHTLIAATLLGWELGKIEEGIIRIATKMAPEAGFSDLVELNKTTVKIRDELGKHIEGIHHMGTTIQVMGKLTEYLLAAHAEILSLEELLAKIFAKLDIGEAVVDEEHRKKRESVLQFLTRTESSSDSSSTA